MGWAAAQVGGWARHVEKPPRGAASQTPHVDSRATLPGDSVVLHALSTCSVRNLPDLHLLTLAKARLRLLLKRRRRKRTMSHWVHSRAVCGVGYLGRRLKPTLLEAL